MATFGILVGGGPAPGINGVIAAATRVARRGGARVLGLREGFRHLMAGSREHVLPLEEAEVERAELLGGSLLQTSRANPTKRAEDLRNVVASLDALGVDHLVTIGGDDTAYSARRVAEEAGGRVRVAHVPKTIDNDLPLPTGIPTFGFETAREHATRVLANLREDARTAGRWYFCVLMGRKAGHLALGAAKSAGVPVALVAEDFESAPLRLARVERILEAAVVKRLAAGAPHGVAVLAEGLGERLEPSDLEGLESVERDEHGHIRLAEVPLGKVLRDAVRGALAEHGVKMTIVEKDVGYELRCAAPNAFDLEYTRDLGAGAVRTLLGGGQSVMITRQESGIVPIPFDRLLDPETGKTRVRLVDTATESYAIARALQERLGKEDLESPERLAAIAEAVGLAPDAARERYSLAL